MFFSVKNLTSLSAEELATPWDWKPAQQMPDFQSKEEFSAWATSPKTDHAFISCYEGVSSSVRVSEGAAVGNGPCMLHGLIVDFDAKQDVAERVKLAKDSPATEFLPAYFYPTLRYMRGVWMFERPIFMPPSKDAIHNFLKIISNRVNFKKWAAGWEEEAFFQPSKYYAMFGPWQPVSPDYRIKASLLHFWMSEACKKVRLAPKQAEIPLEKIKDEIDKRWPGRWTGTFEEGSRGKRVWDPAATDDTSCIVHKDGLINFASGPGFMSWGSLLGQTFMESYEADRIAPLLETTVYDEKGGQFYIKQPGDLIGWEILDKADFARRLRVSGFDSRTPRGETASPVDTVMDTIKRQKSVKGARPFIFMKPDRIIHNGEWILNISTVKPHDPAPAGTIFNWIDYERECPFISKFLGSFFDDPEDVEVPQVLYFMAWLKHFYVNALNQAPSVGQALILAGPEGIGKTFLVENIIGKLMGGVCPCQPFMVDGQPWTDFVYYPVATVDDATALSDRRKFDRYSSVIKAMVANTTQTMNTKYAKTGSVKWHGRAVVCCNDDAASMQMIPTLEISSQTKISLLRVKRSTVEFSAVREENNKKVEQELPSLARFLLEWKIPSDLVNTTDPRYLLKPYHHADLYIESVQAGSSQAFFELLYEWHKTYKEHYPDKEYWSGTTAELLTLMAMVPGMSHLLAKYDPYRVGRELGLLASKRLGIEKMPMHCGTRRYFIPFAVFRDQSHRDGGFDGRAKKGKRPTSDTLGNKIDWEEDEEREKHLRELFAEASGTGLGEPARVVEDAGAGILLAGDGAHGGSGGRVGDGSAAGGPADQGGAQEVGSGPVVPGAVPPAAETGGGDVQDNA